MSFVRDPSVTIVSAYNLAIEEFCESLQRFDVTVKQLTGGDFKGGSTIVDMGDVSIIRRTSQAKYTSSGCFEGTIAFVFSLKSPALFVNGYQYDEVTQIASVENVEASAIFPENSDQLMVAIKVSSLSHYLSESEIEEFIEMLRECEKKKVNRNYKEAATQFIFQIFLEVQRLYNDPQTLDIAGTYCGMVISYLYNYLIFHKEEDTRKNSNYERVFQRGLRYIEREPEFSIDMDTLASELYASKRSIQYAFVKVSGLSPMQFIKAAKMHEIRRELLTAKQTSSNLSNILNQYQVKNLGRFSREYYDFFGERPKGTISRPL